MNLTISRSLVTLLKIDKSSEISLYYILIESRVYR